MLSCRTNLFSVPSLWVSFIVKIYHKILYHIPSISISLIPSYKIYSVSQLLQTWRLGWINMHKLLLRAKSISRKELFSLLNRTCISTLELMRTTTFNIPEWRKTFKRNTTVVCKEFLKQSWTRKSGSQQLTPWQIPVVTYNF